MLSRGVPMFAAGDEVRRTQRGNNNAYCQDNEISWFDWSLVEKHHDMLRFWQSVIDFRKRFPVLRSREFYGEGEIAWHGTALNQPQWEFPPDARVLAFTIAGQIHVMLNMHWETHDFEVPPGEWSKAIDTSGSPLAFGGSPIRSKGAALWCW